eukprot:3642060-Prymnesium_polylepis.1
MQPAPGEGLPREHTHCRERGAPRDRGRVGHGAGRAAVAVRLRALPAHCAAPHAPSPCPMHAR